jgi:hypothetical protein
LFNLAVHLLLSPIGGGHKAVKASQVEEETHQAKAAGPDFDADQREGNHESVEEGQSGTAVQELGDMVADIERLVPDTPGLQGSSGHLELLGRLTLGETLSSQLPVLLKEVRTFASIPAWLALRVDLGPVLDDGSHRDLLGQSLAFP